MIKDCKMRHKNGNCLPAGGFCTANKNLCEALQNAYRMGQENLERKTGKWIDKWHNDSRYCDQCGAVLEGDYWYWRNNYYCYHCGAKMEVEDAETNF